MWEWINQNSSVLSVIINFLICIIWFVYLHLLLQGQRRRKRPVILISRVQGGNKTAHCLISNLSADIVHIHSLIIKIVMRDEQEYEATITDPYEVDEQEAKDITRMSTQGPLKPGEYIDTGAFGNFIERCIRECQNTKDDAHIKRQDVRSLQITVAASHGVDNRTAIAKRDFYMDENGTIKLCNMDTQQIYSSKERRKILSYLKKFY